MFLFAICRHKQRRRAPPCDQAANHATDGRNREIPVLALFAVRRHGRRAKLRSARVNAGAAATICYRLTWFPGYCCRRGKQRERARRSPFSPYNLSIQAHPATVQCNGCNIADGRVERCEATERGWRGRERMLAGFLTLFVPSSYRHRHALCRRMRTESRQSILLEWKPIGQPPVVFPYTLYLSLSKRDVDDDYECYKFAVWTARMTLSCSNGNTPRGLGAGTIRLPPTMRV